MNEIQNNETPQYDPAEIEKQILAFVGKPTYQPLKPRVIASKLDYDADQRYLMRRIIKRLVREGRLVWGARHLVMTPKAEAAAAAKKKIAAKPDAGRQAATMEPERKKTACPATVPPSPPESGFQPATSRPEKPRGNKKNADKIPETSSTAPGTARSGSTRSDEIVGVYRRASAGYGFVSPDGSPAGDRSQDVFIPQGRAADAVDRDIVRVKIRRGRAGPRLRLTGTVIDVVQRKRHRFVGTLIQRGKRHMVNVDGSDFDRPILVGDATARSGKEGDKVVIEMIRFPAEDIVGEAVIIELLGPRGQPGVDTQTIIWQFGLPGEFPDEVIAQTRQQADQFTEKIEAGRIDLTGDVIVTIDPATARDFDDAISLTRNDNGTWRLGVHIADVSHFVPAGTPLDVEALERGNSVYLPDRVIPMLPETLSNGLASLQPDQLRYTLSVHMTIDQDGMVLDTEWCRGAIRSAHRFNYEEVDEYLADDKPWKERLSPEVFQLVRDMHTLAMTMRRRRMKRGSIDLVLPEVTIDLDENGAVSGAHVEVNTESHQTIEEFMLAANESVAQKLADLGHLVLRRIHERPSERRLKELTEFVESLGIECDSLEDRFELKRVVELANDMPERQAVHMAVLRSMQKAVYSPKVEGHYALASKAYCHFTSPIRRYPDLVTHRMVGAVIDGERPRADLDYLNRVGLQCSDTEQRAEQAERELNKLKMINYLSSRLGLELDAVITGVESWGVFVQGIELPAEGLVPVENLPFDQYTFDPAARRMSGRKQANQFRLGDRLRVSVEVADPDKRELTFGLADGSRSGKSAGKIPRRGPETGGNRVRVKRKRTEPSGAEESSPWKSDKKSPSASRPSKPKNSGKPPRRKRR